MNGIEEDGGDANKSHQTIKNFTDIKLLRNKNQRSVAEFLSKPIGRHIFKAC